MCLHLRTMMLTLLMLSSSLLTCAFANTISLIPLNNAKAEELIPILEQQLGPESSISAYQNQLVINATAEETAKIKSLIEMLDGSGKQLIISVKNATGGTNTSRMGSINNSQLNDSGLQMSRGNPASETRITTTYQQRGNQSDENNTHGVRATEGYPTHINIGSAVAYNQPVMMVNGQVVQSQQWQHASTGFYATAWVNGDTVSISIEQQKQNFTSNSSMNSQQLETRVSGKLGEWIALGSIHQAQQLHNQTINSRSRSRASENQNNTIYLKVELSQ